MVLRNRHLVFILGLLLLASAFTAEKVDGAPKAGCVATFRGDQDLGGRITSEFDPAKIVKPEIDLDKVEFRFYARTRGKLETGELWYQEKKIGSWKVFEDGTIYSEKLNLGPDSDYKKSGLGSLCYLAVAVRTYDKFHLLLTSEIPNNEAQHLWERFLNQGIAERISSIDEYRFKEEAFLDHRLEIIRRFIGSHGVEMVADTSVFPMLWRKPR